MNFPLGSGSSIPSSAPAARQLSFGIRLGRRGRGQSRDRSCDYFFGNRQRPEISICKNQVLRRIPKTGLIDPESLDQCLEQVSDEQKEKTNVVVPVSFAGSVAPLDKCSALAKAHGFGMIEDASHSPGAWKDASSGSKTKSASGEWEDAATLSFHPVKHICCGEGGAILTNSERLAEAAKKRRSHGIARPFDENHETPGDTNKKISGGTTG